MSFITLPDNPRVYTRSGILIAFAVSALVVSAYAIFLLQHTLIIYPVIHPLPIAIAVEISLLIPLCMILLWSNIRRNSGILPLAGVILLLWLIPQVTFILDIGYEYQIIEDEYALFVSDRLQEGESASAVSWNLSKKYLSSFSSAGNDIRNPVPTRSIFPENRVYTFHLLLYHYLFKMDGLKRLIVTERQGNCSEYTGAVTFLVNETLKIPTRFVMVYGYDHKFAEVKTKDGWLILDPLKTTPDYPVMASGYAGHLMNQNPEAYKQITGISSIEGESLFAEHGFEE